MQGRNPNLGSAITTRAPYCNCGMPLGCIPGLAYLKANNLMTMNPQCSGGVPHRMYRGCRSSDSSAASAGDAAVGSIVVSPMAHHANSNISELTRIATYYPNRQAWYVKWNENGNGSITIPVGQTLTISASDMLVVPLYVKLTNYGTIVNNGFILFTGALDNKGTINNNGVLSITAPDLILVGLSMSVNYNYGTINNAGSGIISVSLRTLNNSGNIVNNGFIETNPFADPGQVGIVQNVGSGVIGPNPVIVSVAAAVVATALAAANDAVPSSKNIQFGDIVDTNGVLKRSLTIASDEFLVISGSNYLTINNDYTLTNYGTIVINADGVESSGNIINYGTIINGPNSRIIIEPQGAIDNKVGGIIDNYNNIFIIGGGTLLNRGTLLNYFNGEILISSSKTFTNQGIVTNYGNIQGSVKNNDGGIIRYDENSQVAAVLPVSAAATVAATVTAAANAAGPKNIIPWSSITTNGWLKGPTTIELGKFLIMSEGAFRINNYNLINHGTILINDQVAISSQIINYGKIIVTSKSWIECTPTSTGFTFGTITNKISGTITNYYDIALTPGTFIDNEGTIANYGLIINAGGTVKNIGNGSITNNPVN